MSFLDKENYEKYKSRTITKFLWWPKLLKNHETKKYQLRWLTKVHIKQYALPYNDGFSVCAIFGWCDMFFMSIIDKGT